MSAYADDLKKSATAQTAWQSLPFFEGDGFADVVAAISAEQTTILPDSGDVFAAFREMEPETVRVVILGQDPYPTPGHAHGLAFSVQADVTPLPRSLNNIFKELEDDIGGKPNTGNLSHWAKQGVLLLNSALTVRVGDLWGKHAQSFRPLIEAGSGSHRLIIESAHPSPLSARRGFFGSKPFSRTNNHLTAHGHTVIDWTS